MKRKTEGSGRDWMYKGGRREERLKMKWKGRKEGCGGGRRKKGMEKKRKRNGNQGTKKGRGNAG